MFLEKSDIGFIPLIEPSPVDLGVEIGAWHAVLRKIVSENEEYLHALPKLLFVGEAKIRHQEFAKVTICESKIKTKLLCSCYVHTYTHMPCK